VPNVHIVWGVGTLIAPRNVGFDSVDCPTGEILTGGGFETIGTATSSSVRIETTTPLPENTWIVKGFNQGTANAGVRAVALYRTKPIIHPSPIHFYYFFLVFAVSICSYESRRTRRNTTFSISISSVTNLCVYLLCVRSLLLCSLFLRLL
jgi:hypothetical protein